MNCNQLNSSTKRQCSRCKTVLPLDRVHFLVSPYAKYGFDYKCKLCVFFGIDHRKAAGRRRKWRAKNPERHKAWDKANSDKVLGYKLKWRTRAIKTNLSFRLSLALRSRIGGVLSGRRKCHLALKLLGCSLVDFRLYLESKFEPGMSWANYGLKGWHIDHIMPCAIFDLTKPEHQKRCFHFSNMQPLWALDNLRKHAKTGDGQFALL